MSQPPLTIREMSAAEIEAALPLVAQLNPDLTVEDLAASLPHMLEGGFRSVGAFLEDKQSGEVCVGVAGIWTGFRFWCGKYLDIDNIVVDENYRSQGIGASLIKWAEELGRREGCRIAVLDSYTHNRPSHRLYHRLGFEIYGFHFVKKYPENS